MATRLRHSIIIVDNYPDVLLQACVSRILNSPIISPNDRPTAQTPGGPLPLVQYHLLRVIRNIQVLLPSQDLDKEQQAS